MVIFKLDGIPSDNGSSLRIWRDNLNTTWDRPVFLLVLMSMYASRAFAWLAAHFLVYPLSEAGSVLIFGTVMIGVALWGRKTLSSSRRVPTMPAVLGGQ